jgi:hypothetical protein
VFFIALEVGRNGANFDKNYRYFSNLKDTHKILSVMFRKGKLTLLKGDETAVSHVNCGKNRVGPNVRRFSVRSHAAQKTGKQSVGVVGNLIERMPWGPPGTNRLFANPLT